jgi:UDP-hydrolysing UDP-N-acetyl-D-glucosamine 2-epimerase
VKRIAVVSVGRSDYGILRPVMHAITAHPDLSLRLILVGMHLSAKFGRTSVEVDADGFRVDARVGIPVESDAPVDIARISGMATIQLAEAFARMTPDLLLLLGDRVETHAAAAAAVPLRLPIAHVHGGELTEGAIDEQYRHAITKLSHLHFVVDDECARRVCQMGEEPWRVTVTGAPALDNLKTLPLASVDEVARRHSIGLVEPFVIVTLHPETLADEDAGIHVAELVAALDTIEHDIVITAPTADPGHRTIRAALGTFAARRSRAWVVPSLGTRDYFSLLARAAAVVGNSSSGILEAASFAVPVVNIGDRQRGRTRARNVIDVPHDRDQIAAAIARAASRTFRESLARLVNPYGDGCAAPRIVRVLAATPCDSRLLRKRFSNVPEAWGLGREAL